VAVMEKFTLLMKFVTYHKTTGMATNN